MGMRAGRRLDDGTDEPTSERRWSERKSVELGVRLEAGGERWEGRARNLSLEGLFVALDSLPPAHLTRFDATVVDSAAERPVTALLDVTHRQAQGIGFTLSLAGGTDFRTWRDLWGETAGRDDGSSAPVAGTGTR